jgi:hypothetical protein
MSSFAAILAEMKSSQSLLAYAAALASVLATMPAGYIAANWRRAPNS